LGFVFLFCIYPARSTPFGRKRIEVESVESEVWLDLVGHKLQQIFIWVAKVQA